MLSDVEEQFDDEEDICSCCSANNKNFNNGYKNRTEHGGELVTSYDEACALISNCSMIVGMHPDQAAEHIIEFALRNHKPFAVVPCCVYQKQFPKRFASSLKSIF